MMLDDNGGGGGDGEGAEDQIRDQDGVKVRV